MKREADERAVVEDEARLALAAPVTQNVVRAGDLGLGSNRALEPVAQLGNGGRVLLAGLAELEGHAGTSSSSTSASGARSRSSRVGAGSPCSANG